MSGWALAAEHALQQTAELLCARSARTISLGRSFCEAASGVKPQIDVI